MRSALLLVLILSSFAARGASLVSVVAAEPVTQKDYLSGWSLCEEQPSWRGAATQGLYVQVPVDYAHPEKRNTDIFAHFEQEFDASLPTMLVFDGGPGASSHQQMNIPGWNTLRFDQRGVGCSRPSKYSQERDPDFFNSEWTARDAEKIRSSLGLETISIYGVSYGTIPATIYASLFPAHAKALVLEGTISSGLPEAWSSTYRRAVINGIVQRQTSEVKQALQSLAAENHLPEYWLSAWARNLMEGNHGLQQFEGYLKNFIKIKPALVAELKNFYSGQNLPTDLEENAFRMEGTAFAMLNCIELSFADPQSTLFDDYKNGKFVPSESAKTLPLFCKSLGIQAVPAGRTYAAEKYPVKIPVTYFQGARDGSTPAPGAIAHYKKVPRGFAQMLILKDGGHNPNLEILATFNVAQLPLQKKMFDQALLGQKIDGSLLQQFNGLGFETWSYGAKIDGSKGSL